MLCRGYVDRRWCASASKLTWTRLETISARSAVVGRDRSWFAVVVVGGDDGGST